MVRSLTCILPYLRMLIYECIARCSLPLFRHCGLLCTVRSTLSLTLNPSPRTFSHVVPCFQRFFAQRGHTTLVCTILLPFVLSSSHLVNNIRILRTEAELVAHFVPLEASQAVAESSPAAIAQIYFLAFNVCRMS